MTLGPFDDFPSAASALLTCLHEQLGVEVSAVTRRSGDTWLALGSVQRTGVLEILPGTTWPWSDTMCSRVAAGRAPRFVPVTQEIEAFRDVSYLKDVAAYVGVPLVRSSGELFGTLCAFDPHPLPVEVGQRMPFVEMTARLLATLLEHELIETEQRRRLELVEAQALRDGLTGLWNRRAWEHFLEQEEVRCARYGHPACVMMIDLDGLKVINDSQGHAAGDVLICTAARALLEGALPEDRVARLGGDEFAILSVQGSPLAAGAPDQVVLAALAAHGVEASIGLAYRQPGTTLVGVCGQADDRMYARKRERKSGRGGAAR